MAAPALPRELQLKFNEMASQYAEHTYNKDFAAALVDLDSLYNEMLRWQREQNQRFDKAYPLHNIGCILRLQNKGEKALDYFTQAFIEDLFSASSRNDIDASRAGQTLQLVYKVDIDDLKPLMMKISEMKNRGNIPLYPAEVIKELKEADPGYEGFESKATITLKQHRLREFGVFYSTPEKRVFIGGIEVFNPIIELLRDIVRQLGYDPAITEDFETPLGMDVYNKCMMLMYNCAYAVFDLSEEEEQRLFEASKSIDRGMKTLIICPQWREHMVSGLVKGALGFREFGYESYDNFERIEPIIGNFLA